MISDAYSRHTVESATFVKSEYYTPIKVDKMNQECVDYFAVKQDSVEDYCFGAFFGAFIADAIGTNC